MDFYEIIRLEIGDCQDDQGILPGRGHFTDQNIQYAADVEGVADIQSASTVDIGRTCAKLLEIASVHWSSHPEDVELGPSVERGKQFDQLTKRAAVFREKWGYGGANPGRPTSTRVRAPAYSGSGFIPFTSPGVN